MALNLNNVNLRISAGVTKQFPRDPIPQVAFSGRSNVGKSSLINSLIGRKSLARVSSAPGKTITVNFYEIDKKLFFVDLPGYSFSVMGKEKSEKISKTIDSYLKNRENIALVVMLVDIRHKPSKDDRMMYEYLINSNLNFIIVPTKADKIAITKVPDYCKIIQDELNCPEEIDIIPVSSSKKNNLEAIWQAVFQTLPED